MQEVSDFKEGWAKASVKRKVAMVAVVAAIVVVLAAALGLLVWGVYSMAVHVSLGAGIAVAAVAVGLFILGWVKW